MLAAPTGDSPCAQLMGDAVQSGFKRGVPQRLVENVVDRVANQRPSEGIPLELVLEEAKHEV